MKRCTKCEMVLPLDEFGSHKEKPDGLTSQCKSCRQKRMRAKPQISNKSVTEPSRPNPLTP